MDDSRWGEVDLSKQDRHVLRRHFRRRNDVEKMVSTGRTNVDDDDATADRCVPDLKIENQ